MDAGYGLRLMQGGVDRTGLASLADAVGTPGLNLIERRRQEQALADAIAAATASENIGDPSVTTTTEESPDIGDIVYSYGKSLDDKFESILTPLGQEKYMEFKDAIRGGAQTAGDMFSSFMEDPNPLKVDPLSVPVDTDGDGVIGEYEQSVADMENELKMMDIRNSLFYNVVDPTKQAIGDFMSSPAAKSTIDMFKLPFLVGKDMFEDKFIDPYFKANGGRVGMANGGLRDSGMVSTSKGYGPAGAGGAAMGPSGNQGGNKGGNQKSQKEVDIDQLKKEEEEKARMVTTTTTLNPALYGLVEDQLSLQTPPEPMQEQSFLDTVSKYNPLQQDFQVTPNLTFGYDINPNLKDLSDINARVGLNYSFGNYNQGGPVSVGMDDNKKTLRISEDDKFIEAEQMLRGDTELYNYLVGGEIMPGLSFELGVMDDAVMEPGMRSPDDLKFFNIKKTF